MQSVLSILSASTPVHRQISTQASWEPKLRALRALFQQGESWMVAFSGGVDSALVLQVAVEERGAGALAMTAVSPTLPDSEREACIAFARRLGTRHLLVESKEMEVEGFRSNPSNRCFFCKDELYSLAWEQARDLGIARIADGVNVDDLGDHRPGLDAASQHGVVHPLVEAGMTKADVRGAAQALGLSLWDKPAFACLSSRFPYGTPITTRGLTMIESVEEVLKQLGFEQVRVRFHDPICRIEVLPADLPQLVAEPTRTQVLQACKRAGFRYTTIDLQGYRTGSLNEGLDTP